jgi:cis-3-alkyl-4-acyloxetan-2-one decarboxylase
MRPGRVDCGALGKPDFRPILASKLPDETRNTTLVGADWKSLYPFQSHWRNTPSGRQHYVDEGTGAPLVMVHGNPTWSFYYRELVQAFRGEHRAIAVDHLGCGLSEKPQGFDYCLKSHVDNLVALWDELDLRQITLLVHDWGGAIGLGAALQRPERIGRLVLFNTGAFPPPFVPLRIRACRTPILGTLAMRGLNGFARAALTMATERPGGLPAEVKAGLIAPYDSWANRIAIDRFVYDIPFTRRHRTWALLEQIEAGLKTLANRPTLMVWGMKDWCFRPECLDRLLTHFPNAEVNRIVSAGHYVIEDAPEEVVKSVDEFLSRTRAAI